MEAVAFSLHYAPTLGKNGVGLAISSAFRPICPGFRRAKVDGLFRTTHWLLCCKHCFAENIGLVHAGCTAYEVDCHKILF